MLHKIATKLTIFAIFSLLFLPTQPSKAFTDTNDHYNEDAIDYLYEKGVIEGYGDGSYAPEDTINRAEFVKILIESKYPGQEYGTNCFPDVGTDWYAPYVCYAEDLEIIEGYGDGYFRPANEINLAEALKIVLETYGIEFTQFSENWLWYAPYQRTADDLNLLYRIDTDIEHGVTRGEMAQFVYNIETYLEEETPTYANGKECFLYDSTQTYVYDYWELLEDYEYDTLYEDDEVTSEEECAEYAEERYVEEDDELTFDDSVNVTSIPNVAILEFDADDECRYSNGNVRGECVVGKFYQNHEDNYDMIMTIDIGEFEDKYNGWSSNNVQRYVPSNLGIDELCDGTCQKEYPERLRYMQQSGDSWKDSSDTIFLHELAHYWGVDWLSTDESCYDESWIEYTFENSHWTELFQAGGGASTMAYLMNSVSEGDLLIRTLNSLLSYV